MDEKTLAAELLATDLLLAEVTGMSAIIKAVRASVKAPPQTATTQKTVTIELTGPECMKLNDLVNSASFK